MDIQKHLENSIAIVKREPLVVIIGGFVVVVANVMSLGILSGPLMGGYLLMMVGMLREKSREPNFNDVFAGFTRFGQLLPFCLLSLLVVVGFIFFVLPGIVMMTWWMYVLLLMADREMLLGQAMTKSRAKVLEQGFFMHLVFAFMITIVPSLLINLSSAIFPLLKILQVLVIPFQCACLASLYVEQFDRKDVSPSSPPPPTLPSSPPPPPSFEIPDSAKKEDEKGALSPLPPEH